MTKAKPVRLDLWLVAQGAFQSRARAQAAVKAGLVTLDGETVEKPSLVVPPGARVAVAGDVHRYVSRGGLKIDAGLRVFEAAAAGKICLDLGASTGGFTDALLQAGAAKVYAVDVGTGQLHPSLASDPRVVNLERTHAKDLTRALIPDEIDLLVSDVSFISLKKALPTALALCGPGARLIALVKPQFEVGRSRIGKGGIVKPGYENAEGVAEDMIAWIGGQPGWRSLGFTESPVTGGDGNREFLVGAVRSG